MWPHSENSNNETCNIVFRAPTLRVYSTARLACNPGKADAWFTEQLPDINIHHHHHISNRDILDKTSYIIGFLHNLLKKSQNPSKATIKKKPQYISKIPYVTFPSRACLRTLPFQWINGRLLVVHTSYEVGFLHSLLKGCHKPSECYHWTSATIQFRNPCAIIPPRGCLGSLPFQELIY